MKYPSNIQGPGFDNGDIVTFTFDGAELTLRLPIVPINRQNEDTVASQMDFRGANTSDWMVDDQMYPFKILAEQGWAFEDAISLDDIAWFRLLISVIEAPSHQVENNALLRSEPFEQAMLDLHANFFKNREDNPKDTDPPKLANRFHGKAIARDHLNWFQLQLSFIEGKLPKPVAMIPINNRFFIMALVEINSLHYPNRTNPYSDTLLREFESNLFNEFISHIDLRYTPETIAAIQACKERNSH